ncbi:hypothetical protein D9M71_647910 [compost metagenome]
MFLVLATRLICIMCELYPILMDLGQLRIKRLLVLKLLDFVASTNAVRNLRLEGNKSTLCVGEISDYSPFVKQVDSPMLRRP